MTKKLAETLGIPSLEEIMKETEETPEEVPAENLPVVQNSNELITQQELNATEHAKAMDEIHGEVLKRAQEITELAFDLDPARAPRMLEVAGQFFKTALDAKNSKRDAQLKLFKLIQDQRKLELEERRAGEEGGPIGSSRAEVVIVEDRNALLQRLRKEAEETKKT